MIRPPSLVRSRPTTRRVFLIRTTCLLLLLSASSARADSFAVTSGFLAYYTGELGGASLVGPQLTVTGMTFGRPQTVILPDQSVDWSGLYTFGGCGNATIAGVSYQGAADGFCAGRLQLTATLQVAALPWVAPAVTDAPGLFRTPFSLTGTILGHTFQGAPLFSVDVTGEGTMASRYRAIGSTDPPMFLTDAAQLTFSEPMAPNPEPSTLVLFGTAFGFVVVAYRKRRA